MDFYFLEIDIRIRMASRESSGNKKAVHFGIPSSRRLLKTIKRFLKVTNKSRVIMDIDMRFFHVYFFLRLVFTWFKSFESLPVRIRSST